MIVTSSEQRGACWLASRETGDALVDLPVRRPRLAPAKLAHRLADMPPLQPQEEIADMTNNDPYAEARRVLAEYGYIMHPAARAALSNLLSHVERLTAPVTGRRVELVKRLVVACVASCTCATKTHEPMHHDEACLYRVLMDAIAEIEASEGRYLSAVKGRQDFRGALKESRGELARRGVALAEAIREIEMLPASNSDFTPSVSYEAVLAILAKVADGGER
jgi:hypothetical protein